MTGRVKGLVARLATVAPHMQFLHCIIHQAVLCAKLSGDLKNTMDTVMNVVNFIRSTSSLQHRLFRMLLAFLFMFFYVTFALLYQSLIAFPCFGME